MKLKRMLSCMMALLLAVSLPVTVIAGEYDLSQGSITVSAGESGQSVTQENTGINNPSDPAPVITQSTDTTSNTVTINADAGCTANVTLDGVNIDVSGDSGEAAIQTGGEGNVVIELDGDNTVQSGGGHAGVEKDNGGSLTITDNNNQAGSLEATGGEGGAGIGGGVGCIGSDITISGGTVEAKGGAGGAGIGGGVGKIGSNITISGGSVEATGGECAAGIGGSAGLYGSDITISGGTVEAKGGAGGAGIGGGEGGYGSNITISGGSVKATGGDTPKKESGDQIEIGVGGGAGIGGGTGGNGSDITISGGNVTANGRAGGAGIGGGAGGNSSNITISGGSVNAKGEESGEGSNNDSVIAPGSGDDVFRNSDYVYSSNIFEATVKFRVLGNKESNKNGQDLPVERIVKNGALIFTVEEEYATLIGNREDLKTLTDQGIRKTVFETNRVSVSIDHNLVMKTTNSGDSFRLRADGTSVSFTTTDQNNKKTLDMMLTGDGTQKEQKEQKEPQEDTNGLVTFEIDFSVERNDDRLNSLLRFLSDSIKASLTLSGGSLQMLTERGIDGIALTTNGGTSVFQNKEVLEQIHSGDSLKLIHDGENVSINVGEKELNSGILQIGRPGTGGKLFAD